MPIHDWTRVDAGIFHDFHHTWITEIHRVLNRKLLPPEYYSLAERIAFRTESDPNATGITAVVVHHTNNHKAIAVVEIVSPGNKNNRHGLRALVEKAGELLRTGVHLLIIDLFPPSARDPQGIHKAIWDEIEDQPFALPADKPLTVAAYSGGISPEAFVQPIAIGLALPEMPLFLTPEVYVPVPLDATYQNAWADVPSFWQTALTIEP